MSTLIDDKFCIQKNLKQYGVIRCYTLKRILRYFLSLSILYFLLNSFKLFNFWLNKFLRDSWKSVHQQRKWDNIKAYEIHFLPHVRFCLFAFVFACFNQLFDCYNANFWPLTRRQPHSLDVDYSAFSCSSWRSPGAFNIVRSQRLIESISRFEPATLQYFIYSWLKE